MNKLYLALISFTLVFASGCAALKEKTGEYVADALRDKIVSDVDDLLEKRGLSRDELKKIADENNDGSLSQKEVIDTAKNMAKDYALLESKNYIEEKIKEANSRIKTAEERNSSTLKDRIEVKANGVLVYLLGLIAAYLGKQVWSAKKDGHRDNRISALEKMTNKDLDGDGVIGSVGANQIPDNPGQLT